MASPHSRSEIPATARALRLGAVAALLLSSTVPVHAFDIVKGALVLRSGLANTDGAYTKEDTDPNNKLRNVSALCSSAVSSKEHAITLIQTDTTRGATGLFAGNFGATQASTIVNAGGSVVSKPVTGNPNHCEISGLTVSKMKGLWKMCTLAAGC